MSIRELRSAMDKKPRRSDMEAIHEQLPDMLVVPVEDEDQYVEKVGLDTAATITELAAGEAHGVERLQRVLAENLDLLSDKDADTIKGIIAEKKANQIKFTEMANKYDETGVSKSARKSLNKLLKEA